MRHGSTAREQGFALLAVLWVLVGISALGLTTSLAAREAIAGAQNRIDLTRAAWRAEECLERARAVIGELLLSPAASGSSALSEGWNTLEHTVPVSPLLTQVGCDLVIRAAGTTIDVNSADEEVLGALFRVLRIPPARSDSLVGALLDWRDPDDLPRVDGAEGSWYEEQGKPLPRNGRLADIRELKRIRGFEELAGLDSLLGTEPDRIALNHAPLRVLAALPGFTDEAVARIAEQRLRGSPIPDLFALGGVLSPGAREALLARYPELVRSTTTEPDAWIVTSHAHAGTPPVTAAVEVRLVRASGRAAIVRRRSWIS